MPVEVPGVRPGEGSGPARVGSSGSKGPPSPARKQVGGQGLPPESLLKGSSFQGELAPAPGCFLSPLPYPSMLPLCVT